MIFFATIGYSQKKGNDNFHGAVATLKSYKALYVLNQSDDKKIRAVIRNINNALEDPRLNGKLFTSLKTRMIDDPLKRKFSISL